MATLGKYELLYQIGTGSMGTVYRALDRMLEREVALKTLRQASFSDPSMTERFYREAKAAARLQHPNIVTIYELGNAGEVVFIAMELLTGSNLRQLISQSCALDTASKLEITAQTCDALAHAHRTGVIHRDIKPSNIFRTNENQAKILDFGIARMPASVLTLSGSVLGTPNYMSPEQILGKGFDGRSDLFSAAIVLFELLTGVHPFQGASIPRRIVSGAPERLRDIDPHFPESLEKMLLRALSPDPADRFPTGDVMASELRLACGELGAPAVRAGSPETGSGEEWRIAEFLRLLPEFDEAIESGKLDTARICLQGMRALEAEDDRFAAAVLEYEGRLRSAERASTRVTTVTGFQRAALLPEEPGGAERPPLPPVPAPEPLAPTSAPRNFFSLRTRTERALASIAVVAALVLLAGSVWSVMTTERHGTSAPPPLGTAVVQANETNLYRGPANSESVIQLLHKGDRVTVLGTAGANRQLAHIQAIAPMNTGRAGYAVIADLGDWSTYRAMRLVQPGTGAPRAGRIAYLHELSHYVETHPKSPDAEEANIQAAELSVELAEAAKSSGDPPQDVQAYVENASKILGRIESVPAASEKSGERELVRGLRESLAMLQRGDAGTAGPPAPILALPAGGTLAVAPAVPPDAAAPEPPYDAGADFHRATAAWQNGEYGRAKRFLKRVLKNDPRNDQARELLERVSRAQAIDPGVSQ